MQDTATTNSPGRTKQNVWGPDLMTSRGPADFSPPSPDSSAPPPSYKVVPSDENGTESSLLTNSSDSSDEANGCFEGKVTEGHSKRKWFDIIDKKKELKPINIVSMNSYPL